MESGAFHLPFGIAVNQTTGNVYVSDYGNSGIDELSSSGSFIRALRYGESQTAKRLSRAVRRAAGPVSVARVLGGFSGPVSMAMSCF